MEFSFENFILLTEFNKKKNHYGIKFSKLIYPTIEFKLKLLRDKVLNSFKTLSTHGILNQNFFSYKIKPLFYLQNLK